MNSDKAITAEQLPPTPSGSSALVALICLATLAALCFIFRDALTFMAGYWQKEEYSHGRMIPFVSAFLIWQRLNGLPANSQPGSWWGFWLMICALAAMVLGELSAIYTIIQYGFLLALFAIALSLIGKRGFLYLLAPLAYLIFMVPLPNYIYFNLSSQLQLLSSQIGVAIIRLFDIPVYLEGNVIDLGSIKLQVVEACSGLRYLFPLMSFGFLVACIYRAPFWQRALLFLSTIPITVLMNSLRIGLIGVTADRWGAGMAEGFLHDFEGWIVFMGCIGILFIEVLLLHTLTRAPGRMLDRLPLELPRLQVSWRDFPLSWRRQLPLIACALLILVVSPWLLSLGERDEIVPERQSFSQFPLQQADWSGREGALDRDVINTLQFSDYIIADYRNTQAFLTNPSVNLYIAWYSSQKKGASIHSPRSCIPGGGWRVEELSQIRLDNVRHVSGHGLDVNRAVIRKGAHTQLVYYWFEGRGRNITNEYLAKWYIFVDSLRRSRSDGALVRVVTSVPEGTHLRDADTKLQAFLADFYPTLPKFTP